MGMNQDEYHYKVTHTDDLRLERIQELDFVDDVHSNVTIEVDNGQRSNLTIDVNKDDVFEELDSELEDMYERVWFDF